MKRRQLLLTGATACAAAYVAAPALAVARGEPTGTLRFGTTPVFLDDQVGFLARWAAYLSAAVGTPVQFVRRRSYRDIMGLLRSQELEAAWICGFPWVVNKQSLRGLSIPVYEGAPLYRSYLIVPSTDRTTSSHADLAGKVFAFRPGLQLRVSRASHDHDSGRHRPRSALRANVLYVGPQERRAGGRRRLGQRRLGRRLCVGHAREGRAGSGRQDPRRLAQPALRLSPWRSALR